MRRKNKIIVVVMTAVLLFSSIIYGATVSVLNSTKPTTAEQLKAEYYINSNMWQSLSYGGFEDPYKVYLEEYLVTDGFDAGFALWKTTNFIFNPNEIIEGVTENDILSEKGFYEAILFEIFYEPQRESSYLDKLNSITKKSNASVYKDIKNAYDSVFTYGSYPSDNELLSDDELFRLRMAVYEQGGTEYIDLFGGVENFNKVVEGAKCVDDFVEKIGIVKAFGEVSQSRIDVLQEMYDNCDDNAQLKAALGEMLAYYGNDFSTEYIIAQGIYNLALPKLIDEVSKKLWGDVVAELGGGWVKLAYTVGKAASNAWLSTDAYYESFMEMNSLREVETLADSVGKQAYSDYQSNPNENNAVKFNACMDIRMNIHDLGYDYAIKYLNQQQDVGINHVAQALGYHGISYDGIISNLESEKKSLNAKYEMSEVMLDELGAQGSEGHDKVYDSFYYSIKDQTEFDGYIDTCNELEDMFGRTTELGISGDGSFEINNTDCTIGPTKLAYLTINNSDIVINGDVKVQSVKGKFETRDRSNIYIEGDLYGSNTFINSNVTVKGNMIFTGGGGTTKIEEAGKVEIMGGIINHSRRHHLYNYGGLISHGNLMFCTDTLYGSHSALNTYGDGLIEIMGDVDGTELWCEAVFDSPIKIDGNLFLGEICKLYVEENAKIEIMGDVITKEMDGYCDDIFNSGTIKIYGNIEANPSEDGKTYPVYLFSKEGSKFEVDGSVGVDGRPGLAARDNRISGEVILNGGGIVDDDGWWSSNNATGKLICNVPPGKCFKTDDISLVQGKDEAGYYEQTGELNKLTVSGGGELTIDSGKSYSPNKEFDLGRLNLLFQTYLIVDEDIVSNCDITMDGWSKIIVRDSAKLKIVGDIKTCSAATEIKNYGNVVIEGNITAENTDDYIFLSSFEGSVFEVTGVIGSDEYKVLRAFDTDHGYIDGDVIINGSGRLDNYSSQHTFLPSSTGKLVLNVPACKSIKTDYFTLSQKDFTQGYLEMTYNGAEYNVRVNGGDLIMTPKYSDTISFISEDDLDLNSLTLSSYTWEIGKNFKLSEDLNVSSNASLLFGSKSTFELNGSKKQIISNENSINNPFNDLIITNTSYEGIEFCNDIKVTGLFNHNQNNFTLYNHGESSSFIDSDGDGAIDSEDFEPTNDKVKGTKLTISEIQDQNSEEGVACTPEITVTREDGKTLRKGIDYTVSYQNNSGVGEAVVKVTGLQIYKNSDPVERKFNIFCENHQYEKTTIEPTCTEDGKDIYTCKLCKYSYEEPIPATGHSWADDYTVDEEPACTKTGLKSIHCSKCEETTDEQIIEALGHEWDDGTVTKENSCTEEGNLEYRCMRDGCDAAYEGAINLTDHSWEDDYTVDVEPTCTEVGIKSIHCQNCKAVKANVETTALGHDYVEHEAKAATCTEKGHKAYQTCSRCDYTTYEEIKALGHDTNTELTKATTTADGSIIECCKTCNKVVETIIIPKVSSIELEYEVFNYDGTAKTPAVTVKDASGTTLLKDKDYEVSYNNNVNVGIATVVITGKGNYSFTKKLTYTIKADIFVDNSTIRYAGANRYETSFLAADGLKQSLGVDKFDNIIVASGDNYPDALAGSYLGKVKNAPILLVTGTTEKTTADYIKSNLKEGGTVYLLGGTGVVSSNFEKMVKGSGVSVDRLAGANRYDTNIAILKEAGVKSEDILVCSGSGYADSLSASAVGKPILLVDEKITAKQQSYLDTLSTKNMYLIGGTGAVSKAVEKDLNGYTLKRFAGANRFETSTMVANEFFPKSECIVLAYGYNFPDGLSGGPLAMSIGAPLVLTSNDSAYVDTAQKYAKSAGVTKAVILGGESLISDGNANSIIN